MNLHAKFRYDPAVTSSIVGFNQLLNDQCTWPWGHCLLFELRKSADTQTGRHNGEKKPAPIDNSVLKESCRLGWCRENGIIEPGGVMDKCVQKLDKDDMGGKRSSALDRENLRRALKKGTWSGVWNEKEGKKVDVGGIEE
ncbi:hypothetical protein TNCV_4917191 [Trichonephila clavipes]|nr:hypothetical protein TNCV_4917191 [Trichonephila clavipes]